MATNKASPPEIPGYELQQLIHSGKNSLVYRGTEVSTDRKVVLKMPRSPYPTDRELAALRRSFDIARELNSTAVVENLEVLQLEGTLVLVVADHEGTSLDKILQQQGPAELENALEISTRIMQAIATVHAENITHKDINPASIILNADTGELRLADLTHSTSLEQDEADSPDDVLQADSLAYISPEQTGRLNRSVDYRSDIYSAGATLFELFSGRPPFDYPEPRDLVHAHLARTPPRLHELVPSVPKVLGAVIEKMLAKNPEDRYATAIGVAGDLQLCLDACRAGGPPNFDPGAAEVQTRLVMPNRLYGREAQCEQLLEAMRRARNGGRQAMLIAGYSGVGKSSLVNAVQVPVANQGGWFCAGKFDQFRRDVPYLGWRGAMKSLVRQLLAKPEEDINQLRQKLTQASAGNIALIGELVPELQTLLGDQHVPAPAGPAEAQARFIQAFRNFVRIIAGEEQLLVLFVDDLQWADLASLRLFQALVSDPEAANVLILGSYRDNEVGPGHPLSTTMDALSESGHRLTMIELSPLGKEHIAEFVTDVLNPAGQDTAELAGLVHSKTGGNPFFLRQFLVRLYQKKLLFFDREANTWNWDLASIDAEDFTDNVVEFMSARIAELPAAAQTATGYASCLGIKFDLQTLARIADRSISHMAADLNGALLEGLVVPIDKNYQIAETEAALAEVEGRNTDINPHYRFLHDRVQQSAHDSISAEDRAQLHLKIARERLVAAEADGSGGHAIDVMEHLAQSIELVTSQDEQLKFARICLSAAERAKAAMAITPAADYLEMGRSLLSGEAERQEPRLALDLLIESTESAYTTERYEDAERFAELALSRATDLEDRVVVHNVRIGIGVAQRRYVDATRYGIDVLNKELGIRIPSSASTPRMLANIFSTRLALRNFDDEAILNLQDMQDPRSEAAMAMMMKCATNAYWANQLLVPILAGHMIRLSLQHGKSGLTAYGLALLGMIISQALNAVDYGCRIGALSMEILERTGDTHLIGKTGLLWHGMIRHCKEPLQICMADTLECYHHAMDAGDVENAVYCGTVAYYGDLLSGRSLDWVEKRYRNYLPALLETGQAHTTLALNVWRQVVANLEDKTQVEPQAKGEIIDWPATLVELRQEEGSDMSIATVVGGTGWLAFLLDDREEAEHQFSLLYEREQNALGQCFWKPCMSIYAVILELKLAAGTATLSDKTRLKRLRRAVKRWAHHNPHDYLCYCKLLDAEAASAADRVEDALFNWTEAMELAHESGILYIEAWAAERAADAHADAGHTAMARHFERRASEVWQQHGNEARLRLLRRGASADDGVGKWAVDSSGGRSGLMELDFDTVLSAIRALSDNIELEDLAARVLELSLLNSGARRGVLLIQDRLLEPYVVATLDEDNNVQTSRADFDLHSEYIPKSLIDYVTRTDETVLISDAQTHEWLSRDPYVLSEGCRSMLATPLLLQGKLVGIALLENDLGPEVFSKSDATLIQTIAGQAAVSLENARLFDSQRRQNESFSRFVPRPFLEHLGHEFIEDVRLGDAVERRVSVMFGDLRGFTALSEAMDRADSFALINAFIARMAPGIQAEGGFIDEFTGDGFKALFIDRPDGAARAAISLQQRLRRYNKSRVKKGWVELTMGVGVHTGQSLLGTIGTEDRASTTVIGDTVNTAARLEGLTKMFTTPSLISGTTFNDLENPESLMIRTVGRVRVKGRQEPISVYELVDARPEKDRQLFSAILEPFNEAMEAYFDKNFAMAAKIFSDCLTHVPGDALTSYYYGSTIHLLQSGVEPDWNGIIVREEK